MVEVRWLERGGGAVCAELLALLPDWFGVADANQDYRQRAEANPTVVAYDGDAAVGMLTLVGHSSYASEISVMAVHPERHRAGFGRRLVDAAEHRLLVEGVEYLQVKTLSAAARSEAYRHTRAFYAALGFRELEEMPLLWGPDDPAQIFIKRL